METIRTCLDAGNKVLICGNGGSAAQADHFMAEMIGSGFACISLTNSAVITALGNDYGFDDVFSRQVYALGQPGDVLILISTSGESENVRSAYYKTFIFKEPGIETIVLPDKTQEEWKDIDTQTIQETHIKILHQIWKELHENR